MFYEEYEILIDTKLMAWGVWFRMSLFSRMSTRRARSPTAACFHPEKLDQSEHRIK